MIEYSKKKPGQVRIGHPGSGSVGDFCVQLINALTGAELVPVPYAGAAPAIAALRGEHIEGVMQAPKEIYCSRAAAAARASGTTS